MNRHARTDTPTNESLMKIVVEIWLGQKRPCFFDKERALSLVKQGWAVWAPVTNEARFADSQERVWVKPSEVGLTHAVQWLLAGEVTPDIETKPLHPWLPFPEEDTWCAEG
ncbi:MAG: hypothetical protein L0Z53_06665 [Acidobacteriales bacterium]|nr:hypothetical protein [Terriglobales bacterium]